MQRVTGRSPPVVGNRWPVLCHGVLPSRSRIRAADARVKSGQLDAASSREFPPPLTLTSRFPLPLTLTSRSPLPLTLTSRLARWHRIGHRVIHAICLDNLAAGEVGWRWAAVGVRLARADSGAGRRPSVRERLRLAEAPVEQLLGGGEGRSAVAGGVGVQHHADQGAPVPAGLE